MKTAEDEEFERIEREARMRFVNCDRCGEKLGDVHTCSPQQPAQQQEPVAWQWLGSAHFRKKIPKNSDMSAWKPLYTTPQAQRKPLTDKEIWGAIRPLTKSDEVCTALIKVSIDEYRAIEAAHGIKEKNNG